MLSILFVRACAAFQKALHCQSMIRFLISLLLLILGLRLLFASSALSGEYASWGFADFEMRLAGFGQVLASAIIWIKRAEIISLVFALGLSSIALVTHWRLGNPMMSYWPAVILVSLVVYRFYERDQLKKSFKPKLPLEGLKIVDLSRVLAGPYATQILGDMGADVLKVERPEIGDDTRAWGPPFFEGTSAYFLSANRNKKSIALDLSQAKDRSELLSLISKADVLVENFKVDGLKKYGLDFESLQKKYPRLIYCSISGFGQTGPLAREPGYDVLIQAMGGIMSITGPSENQPTKVGVALADLMTGLYAVIGILSAIREREYSQRGQRIDLSLFEVQISSLINIAMNFLVSKEVPKPMGNDHPSIMPYGVYETKDKPILLAIGNDAQFKLFSESLSQRWHEDEFFQSNEQRVLHRSKLKALIHQELKNRTRDEWMDVFKERGFPFGPILNLEEIMAHPQAVARNIFTTMDDQKTPCIRSPLHFSRTPIVSYKRPPPLPLSERTSPSVSDISGIR